MPLKDRGRRLNRRQVRKDRKFVLCWLQQAIRAYDNPIIDAAVSLGNRFGLPVVVYHGIDDRYPYASERLHRFLIEASVSLEEGLARRRLRFCRHVRTERNREPNLVYRLGEQAAAIVTDDMPTFVARRQAVSVARKAPLPVFAVDAACLVPTRLFAKAGMTTKQFRAAHRPLRNRYLAEETDLKPDRPKYRGRLCFQSDDLSGKGRRRITQLIRQAAIDLSVSAVPDFPGNREAALRRLAYAAEHVVPRYRWIRNNPAAEPSTSKLSPYLHFGVLGPREVVRAIEAAVPAGARWKFFDELLTWREYCHYLAAHAADPAAYENVPEWARKTLADHTSDKRPQLYELDDLIHGRTDDKVWNVAQRQFLLDGWMHNNLRMYWVKQIIKWRPTPDDAWRTACYLNDRLSLDGRDPSTYGGIQWGFGRSRKAYRETPVYGWVPQKSDSALRKRQGFEAWMRAELARKTIDALC